MNLDFNLDLINFINQEKNNKKILSKKVYKYFNICLIKSFVELQNKFINIQNKNLNVISGINMIYYIYFSLVNYSNNIKLTIFLLERAILLYTEFIIMSQDKKVIDEICFVPNTADAISFAYKKTIGPLKINDFVSNKKNMNNIRNISFLIKNIYIKVLLISDINLNENLNNVNLFLEKDLFDILEKPQNYKLYYDKINYLINVEENTNILLVKLKILLETIKKYNKKINTIENLYNEVINDKTLDSNINYINYKSSLLYKKINTI